jgi:hypothetical protein
VPLQLGLLALALGFRRPVVRQGITRALRRSWLAIAANAAAALAVVD